MFHPRKTIYSLLLAAILLPGIVYAQGVQYTRKEAGDGGTAVPYPLVTVCTSGAAYTPLPCTPKASIYSDAALAVPLANPFRGDMFGNIEFYATPAAYIVSVTAPYSPGYSFKMSASGGFAGTIQDTQVAVGTAANTIGSDGNLIWGPSEEDPPRKKLTVQGGLGVLRPYNYTNALNSTWSIDFGGHQANAATATFGAIQQKVISNTNGAVTGQFDFFVENAGTPFDALTLTNTGITSPKINGIRVVDGVTFTTIQAAITNAGTTGAVLIPPGYAGTDTYTNPNGISIDDRRVTNGLYENRVFSVIAPSFPVTNYPGGNDLVLRTRGSADSYREHLVTKTTTATALNVGANNNILVAAVTVGNLTRGTLQTGDTSLLGNPSILGLSIGRDTANAEVVLGGAWSVVDATHLNITCAKSHASIVDIDLGAGDLLLSVGTLVINSAVVKATQTSTYNPPLVINDSTGVTIGKWPTNRGDIWPYSAWQFSAPVTGGYSGGVDLYLRALTAAAKLQYWDFAGAEKLWDVSNDGIWLINGNGSARPNIQLNHDSASGNGGQFLWQYNGATSLLISAQADTPHIYGGGTSSGISFYGSSGGTGTSGVIRFRNNGTDETQKASLDTSNGNLTSVGFASFGPVTVATLPAAAAGNKGQMITVSDSTAIGAEGQTCVGGSTNTALAFSNGVVWKCF